MHLCFCILLTVALFSTTGNTISGFRGTEVIGTGVENISQKIAGAMLSLYKDFSAAVSKVFVVADCEASYCPTDEIFSVMQGLSSKTIYVSDKNFTAIMREENLRVKDASKDSLGLGLDLGTSADNDMIPADSIDGGILGFVIISDGAKEDAFTSTLESLSTKSLWDPEYYFIYILAKPVEESSKEIENILRNTWEIYEVLKCVIVYTPAGPSYKAEEVLIKRFNPFENGGKIHDISRTLGNSCIFCQRRLDTKRFPMYVSMTHFPPFLYVHENKAGNLSYSGPLYLLVENFARVFNFSLVTSGDFVANETQWSIPKAYFNEPGYHANGYVLFRPEFLRITTFPISFDSSAFVVPKAQQMPMWMNAVLPFTLDTWIAYLLFIIITSISCYVLSHHVFGTKVPNFLPLEMFRLFFVGASEHPLESTSIRLFFTAAIIFNIIFNNAYTGSFSSYIMVPQFFKDYETLEEAVADSLSVAIPFRVASNNSISTMELASGVDVTDARTQLIMQNTVFVDTYASALEMAKTARNVCVMSTGLVGLYDTYSQENYDGDRPLLHVIPGGMMSLMYTYRTRPHFPFRGWLNTYVIRLHDLGFTNKGRQELVNSIKSISSLTSMEGDIIPLSLEHLQTFFYIWVVGVLLSLLVFFLEAYFSFIRHNTISLILWIVNTIKKF